MDVIAGPALAQRLPQTTTPDHYDLVITPNLGEASFAGDETIHVTIRDSTVDITLNAAEIAFDRVTITQEGREQTASVSLNGASEQATFHVTQPLQPGTATIHVGYKGILNDKLRGLYLSKTEKRSYAVTQLEATDARRMFPGFDEPAFKASFSLTAVIDEGDHAISNGLVVSDRPGPGAGKHTVVFDTTPKMSTYLVALAVGDFACREGSADGIPIRVCSTHDKRDLTAFALEAAQKNLEFFNRYYAIKYPFKKLDILGVPDFAAGAMENTAAIFFREADLLLDPAQATDQSRKLVAEILAHEMAHQWFGDLVTMQWWDDIWLNEGFASWMETKPLKAWNPAWHSEVDEVGANLAALRLDSLQATRAIRTTADTPAEINELFDAIAYQKGAAVLRMVEGYVGETAFRNGVNAYIRQFQYGNARAEDFWTVMARTAEKPVDRVMRSFVDQPGAPLVSIDTRCTSGSAVATLRQERYSEIGKQPSAGQEWQIPVCLRLPDGSSRCEVLAGSSGTIPLPACPAWVLGNAGGAGYYRVSYPAAMVSRMAADIARLSPPERLSLLADEWALVRAGRQEITAYLDLSSALAGDRNDAVMELQGSRLEWLGEYVTTGESRPKYRTWIQHLLTPALVETGWAVHASESPERKAFRAAVIETLGESGRDPEVLAKARTLALRLLEDPAAVDPTLRGLVVNLAAIDGDATLYERYLARARAVSEPDEHYRYLYALARFSDPALTRRTMDLILSPEVRTQDAAIFAATLIAANVDSRELAWRLIRERWSELEERIGPFLATPTVVGSLTSLCGHDKAEEVRRFFSDHPVPDAQRTLQQSLESVELCGAIASAQTPVLAGWLDKQAAK